MAKIKIISNPYQKEVLFQRWNEETEEWVKIDYSDNPNSKLLKKEIIEGFFPFRAKQIMEQIVEEYGVPGEEIDIVFEGSSDEYDELKAVCEYAEFSAHVALQKSKLYLENARDILPEVKNLFQEMSPLIMKSVSGDAIQRNVSRFIDASSDVVPICVLGNYSAGKSTYINALIGNEVLPSGTEPVTAKIYKISRAKYSDRARVEFQYLGQEIQVLFTDNETIIEPQNGSNPLCKLLDDELREIIKEPIAFRVNKVISVINTYENNAGEAAISDLIEVEIPFQGGILAKSQHPFVLFDTPGSNSASNARHLKVLKKAMANMTNGLPIFLSTPDSLDSTDNENLYHIIRELEELDNRFTMIVVNKADIAGFQRRGDVEQEQKRILNQAVPRNLYSGGLFYISSIIGLGAKTNGKFYDYSYEDVFDAQERRYSDPENKHYRTLYKYDIMPFQIKRRAEMLAAEQSDLVYTNSGLFTVETEIEAFAGKYAAYNKCFQSQMFLRKVIDITKENIDDQRNTSEEIRQSIRDKLESDKKQLVDRLDLAAKEEASRYDGEYEKVMLQYLESAEETFTVEELKAEEDKFTEIQKSEHDFEEKNQDVSDAMNAIGKNLVSNVSEMFNQKKFDWGKIGGIFQDLASDVSTALSKEMKKAETQKEIDRAAADDLLKHVTDTYQTKLAEMHSLIEEKSREYWTWKTELIRDVLAQIVSGSEVLTDERRQELRQIIITYQKLYFSESSMDEIFKKDYFEWRIQLFGMTVWQSDHLAIGKLAEVYNSNMKVNVAARYESIKMSHSKSAHDWIQSLLDEIYSNIVKYSPELSKQARQIKSMTERIEDLVERNKCLQTYTEHLCAMMDWKLV